jgi:hypothetical protein
MMEITFTCDACGQHINASSDMVGQVFACPNPACGYHLTVPAGQEQQPEETVQEGDIMFDCPFCSHNLCVSQKGAGLQVACPECGEQIVVPAPAQAAIAPPDWMPPPPPPPPRPTKPAQPPVLGEPPQSASTPSVASVTPERKVSPVLAGMPPAAPESNAHAFPLPAERAGGAERRPSVVGEQVPLPGARDARVVMGAQANTVAPKPAESFVGIGAEVFREAMKKVVGGAIGIAALLMLQGILGSCLKADGYHGGMTLSDWVKLGISLAVAGMGVRLYRPVKTLVTFYLTALYKLSNKEGGNTYLGNLAAACGKLTMLVFVVLCYVYLLPQVTQLNRTCLHFRSLTSILSVIVLLVTVGILVMLWKNAQPLIDHLTGHITTKVSTLSSAIAYVDCPACKTKNDRDAAFCISCGGAMMRQASISVSSKTNVCAQCAAENQPGSKFCYMCGSAL